jgi:ankyrin repeat protein
LGSGYDAAKRETGEGALEMTVMSRVGGWLIAVLTLTTIGAAAGRDDSLLTAARQGNVASMRALLKEKANPNATEPDGTTPLHYAVRQNSVEGVDLLLGAQADAKVANRYGVTPLWVACTNGNASIIERLIKAGADPNAPNPEGETPLMTAARTGKVEAVRMLLVHGAKVDAKEQWRGQTALMWASAENNATVVKALVEAGADVSTRTSAGFDALLFAVRAGSAEAVEALLQAGADPSDVIRPAAPARAAAARPQPAGNAAGAPNPGTNPRAQGDPGVQQLLQVFNTGSRGGRGNIGGTSALTLAVTNGHFELASLLIDWGADVNADEQGWSPLHQVAWTRRPPIQHGLPPAVQTGDLDSLTLAKKLLEYGANPNSRMTREPSDGARNVLNRIGSTPFLQAAKLGDHEYMRLLLKYGADASIKTEEGATPMMAAAGVGIWQLGESAGSNEDVFEAVKICYEQGNDVNAVDVNGYTALHGAAHRGSNDIVQFLVEKGAKLDVPNKLGWTPWIIADGVFYPNTYNRRPETAALLLKLGANPNVGSRRPEDLPPSEASAVASAPKQ